MLDYMNMKEVMQNLVSKKTCFHDANTQRKHDNSAGRLPQNEVQENTFSNTIIQ